MVGEKYSKSENNVSVAGDKKGFFRTDRWKDGLSYKNGLPYKMDCFNCRQHTSLYSRQNGQVSTRRRRRVGDALEQKAFREVHHFQTTFETTFDDISSHL